VKILAKTPGRRVYPVRREDGHLDLQQPGDYWKDEDGSWSCCTPNNLYGWLKNHHVEEHEDGTISVVSGPWGSNSILVYGGADNRSWHGAIDRGVWKEF
jgi:hypothetical protein